MLLVERHHIAGNSEIIRLCSYSRELYNQCNFFMRHAWFGNNTLPDKPTGPKRAKKEKENEASL